MLATCSLVVWPVLLFFGFVLLCFPFLLLLVIVACLLISVFKGHLVLPSFFVMDPSISMLSGIFNGFVVVFAVSRFWSMP